MQPIVKALLSRPEISALVMLLAVVAGFALYAPQFASSGNIRVMLHFSNLGNWIFATGGQRQAADDMGIDTRRVKLFCFMLCSFLAAFAGMITTFRLKSALPALGEGLELQAIAAAVIGGTALTGGIGSVIGIIVGTCLIRAIDNGLVMARIDANWFRFAIGALTIVAVILNTTVRQRARRMR